MTQEAIDFSDETLTAYLDGELDAATASAIDAALATDDALAERLGTLDFPMQALQTVMAPAVLGAPALPAELTETAQTAPASAAQQRRGGFGGLALVASFFVGMVATTLVIPKSAPDSAFSGWTAAVASYQSLYVTETLSGATQDADVTASVLARATEEFDVDLAPAIELEGFEFKRAQMLGFRGKPLLQMAYLSPEGTPLALCLIRTDTPDKASEQVEMFDLAGVSWVKDGVGYFLIGGDNATQIDDLSARMVTSL